MAFLAYGWSTSVLFCINYSVRASRNHLAVILNCVNKVWEISKEYFKTVFLSNKCPFIHFHLYIWCETTFGMGRNYLDMRLSNLGSGAKQPRMRGETTWIETTMGQNDLLPCILLAPGWLPPKGPCSCSWSHQWKRLSIKVVLEIWSPAACTTCPQNCNALFFSWRSRNINGCKCGQNETIWDFFLNKLKED